MSLELAPDVLAALQAQLPTVAADTLVALVAEVPDYAGALDGRMGETIVSAVQLALAGFLRVAASADSVPAPDVALDGAYALGRGEARSGRTTAALLGAYRVGARVAWRELSTTAVAHGLAASTIAEFAELVFAYIDELSASSVHGHSDELATSGRVRDQYRESLGQALLDGAEEDVLTARAARADWEPPTSLAAVLLPSARVRAAVAVLDARTLVVAGPDEDTGVLLVPDRAAALRLLTGRGVVVGPARPWLTVTTSYARALRARSLGTDVVDTEEHLAALVLGADPAALADLRSRALAPLAGLRPATAERLTETLRAWLLHQGRREEVAAELFVHAQTVRYRMTQLRELYGERLTDPEGVLELVVALAVKPSAPGSAARPPVARRLRAG